jgi:autotransporter-associated beta strand protein
VTVTSPGILNLNGLNQQIGALSGNGTVGTGSGTLTIDGSTDTLFTGALKNTANAGAGGVTTGNGRLIKNGTGVITFGGLNDIAGSVTLNAGGIIVKPRG